MRGLPELARALQQLPAEIAGKGGGPLLVGLRAGAQLVADAARERAPADSGALRRGIVVRRQRDPQGATERVTVSATRDVFYGQFVEQGTSRQKAQPFLRPAFDENKELAVNALSAALANAIEKANRKLIR